MSKKALLLIIILIVISPIFGVVLAEAVNYHEPLDVAAEELGLEDLTEHFNWTPLLDYTVPGLPNTIGYIIAGFIGTGIILLIGKGLAKILGGKQ